MKTCPDCKSEWPEGADYCPRDGHELASTDYPWGIVAFLLATLVLAIAVLVSGRQSTTYVASNGAPTQKQASAYSYAASASPSITPSGASSCLRWDSIREDHSGRTVCAYGIIRSIEPYQRKYTRYEFTNEPNTFFMFTLGSYYYTATGKDVAIGDCISATAKVQVIQGVPFMDIGEGISACP